MQTRFFSEVAREPALHAPSYSALKKTRDDTTEQQRPAPSELHSAHT